MNTLLQITDNETSINNNNNNKNDYIKRLYA